MVLRPDLSIYENTNMNNPAYSVAAGLLQLTRWMSTVLAPKIRVNSISQVEICINLKNLLTVIFKNPLKRMGSEMILLEQ